jgi:methylated-DNA-[protein]-cysteine S-methyltransferase
MNTNRALRRLGHAFRPDGLSLERRKSQMAQRTLPARSAQQETRARRSLAVDSPPDELVDQVTTFRADLGWVAIRWRGPQVRQLVFAYANQPAALAAVDRPAKRLWSETASLVRHVDVRGLVRGAASLVERVRAHLAGERVEYGDVAIAADDGTEFQLRVLQHCREIGWGETCTYGELAELAGRPGAARAVGSVMSRNRFPLIVPCHRVVPASGKLGGFSAPGGVATKLDLLKREKAVFAGVPGSAMQ